MSQKMKHGQGLSIFGRDYHIRYLSVLAGIGGVMLIRHIINDSLGGLCICISQSMSPGASMSLRCGVSGLLLQAVSTSVLLEVRSSLSLPKMCIVLSLIVSRSQTTIFKM